MLWLEGIGCRRHGSEVLESVTLGVSPGDLVVIEGSQASGKSTLLEIAATLRTPERGAVWFASRNTTTLQRASLPFVRRNIGYYAPEALLVRRDTSLANVVAALAVRGEPLGTAEGVARDALALLHAEDLATRLVGSLSSGQRRRVALARALAGPPPLVVADEPAALLDDEARAVVIAALVRARDRGAAVLTATADTAWADAVVATGGRKIHLAGGRITGAPAVELVPPMTSHERADETPRLLSVDTGGEEEATVAPPAKGPR